jgi:Holliday junction resolvase
MARTPEGAVKAKVKKELDELGAYHFAPPANGYGRMGVPDIVGCYRGYFFAIECKAGRGKPTELQLLELERIREAGGIAIVVNEANLEDVRSALRGKL